MIDRLLFLKSLNDIKLILGNGFDLHCKLHSSYKNYYQKHKAMFVGISGWLERYLDESLDGYCFFDNPVADEIDEHENTNLWDYFFGILFAKNDNVDYSWFDIERIIQISLMSDYPQNSIISWEHIFRIYNSKLSCIDSYPECDAMCSVIHKLNSGERFASRESFYEFLLSELNKFESNFGFWIKDQHLNLSRDWLLKGYVNERYLGYAIDTINLLCDLKKNVSIDIFNYEYIGEPNIDSKSTLINGGTDFPIFGIDSKNIVPSDPRYIFTKTNRHITNGMASKNYSKKPFFKNVVVYGHSLNEYDYSYLFPILDKIKIADFDCDSIFVFAYSIYDKEKKESIEKDIRNRLFKFFKDYVEERNLPDRFLDSLSVQNRVLTVEIPCLDKYDYENYFDDKEYEDDEV